MGNQLICQNCGYALKPNWSICPKCKTQVGSLKCAKCGEELEADWDICPNCQQPVGQPVQAQTKQCFHCGEELEIWMDICPNCKKEVSNDAGNGSRAAVDLNEKKPMEEVILEPKDFALRMNRIQDAIQDAKIEEEIEQKTKEELSENKRIIKQYVNKARKIYEQGNTTDAIKVLNEAIDIDNNAAARAYLLRSQIYMDMGEFEQAMEDINMTINVNPIYGDAYLVRGGMYFKAQIFNEAINDYNVALKYLPTSVGYIYSSIGDVFFAQKNYLKALEYYELAIANGYSDDVYKNRGWAHYYIDEYNNAINDFEKAIAYYNDFWDDDQPKYEHEIDLCYKGLKYAEKKLK